MPPGDTSAIELGALWTDRPQTTVRGLGLPDHRREPGREDQGAGPALGERADQRVIEDWVPDAPAPADPVAELTRRYFRAFGPAPCRSRRTRPAAVTDGAVEHFDLYDWLQVCSALTATGQNRSCRRFTRASRKTREAPAGHGRSGMTTRRQFECAGDQQVRPGQYVDRSRLDSA